MKTPEFEIESGIPVSRQIRPPYGSKYPFAALKPGQSFFVPGGKAPILSSLCVRLRQETGHRYATRTVDGGVRVWRRPDDKLAKPVSKKQAKKRAKK